jgi:acetyl-CoA carboxylase biotin carboxyl carrier protein
MASTPEGRRGIARVADEILPALMARLSASGLGELELSEGDWRVRLRRDPTTLGSGTRKAAIMAGERGAERGTGGDPRAAARSATPGRTAAAPAVGYFSPSPGLAVGKAVRAGDVLGHVDVLGVPVELVAHVDGRIGRLHAVAGQAVEYGQELVRIDALENAFAATGTHAGPLGAGEGEGALRIAALGVEGADAAPDFGFEAPPVVMVE